MTIVSSRHLSFVETGRSQPSREMVLLAEDLDAPTAPLLAIEMFKGEARFRCFTTLTTLGTPYDITLHELRVESFFPADEATEEAVRRLLGGGGG